MNIYLVALVIFLTTLVTFLVAALVTSSPTNPAMPADPAPLPGELPHAGYFELPREFGQPFDLPGVIFEIGGGPYGPFPADTGPLLILSEQAAALVAHEREVRAMITQAEAKIPPRWRS